MTTPTGTELYTIRRQVLRLFGAGFDITGAGGAPIGYCEQKAFKFKEDMRIFTDRTKSQELLRMKSRQVIDFGATYDVFLPSGEQIGSLRRKGLASSFIRDSWLVFDSAGKTIGALKEDSTFAALVRRFVELAALIFPQKFHLRRTDASGKVNDSLPPIATFRTHFNPFIYRLSITVHAEDADLDDLMLLATGCLIAAIEGRQRG
jgi:hypothetical protein